MAKFVAKKGEPLDTIFDPDQFNEFVEGCGCSVAEFLTSEDINDRYLSDRKDDFKVPAVVAYCHAVV